MWEEKQHKLLLGLPIQDTVWKLTVEDSSSNEEKVEAAIQTSATCLRVVTVKEVHQNSTRVLYHSVKNSKNVMTRTHILQSFQRACLKPMYKCPRKPRYLEVSDQVGEDSMLDLNMAGIQVLRSGDLKNALARSRCLQEDLPWFRSCHGCGRRGSAAMLKSCPKCDAVLFCDEECQKLTDHSAWCHDFSNYMKLEQLLGEFPFSFTLSTTARGFNVYKVRAFLRAHGVHSKGLWRRECKLSMGSYINIPFGELMLRDNIYGSDEDDRIFSEALSPPDKCPTDWAAYFTLRGLSLDSPVAAVLHFSLTLAWIVAYRLQECNPAVFKRVQDTQSLCIHIIGAAKEADLIESFKECSQLLQPVVSKLHLCLVGPELSESCHQHQRQVTAGLTCSLYSGLYHHLHQLMPPGDLALSFNAGLGAYTEYQPTVELIVSHNVPYFCTDYCMASYKQSKDAVERSGLATLSAPEINPFRCPLRLVYTDMDLPRYGNAIVFTVQKHINNAVG